MGVKETSGGGDNKGNCTLDAGGDDSYSREVGGAADAQAQLDFALTADFDSSLFDSYWTENTLEPAMKKQEPKEISVLAQKTETPLPTSIAESLDGRECEMLVAEEETSFAPFLMPGADVSGLLQQTVEIKSSNEQTTGTTQFGGSAEAADFSLSKGVVAPSVALPAGNAAPAYTQQLHPMAISSSANCPRTAHHTVTAPLSTPQQLQQQQVAQTTTNLINPALIPLAFNALASGYPLAQQQQATFQQQQQLQALAQFIPLVSSQQQASTTSTVASATHPAPSLPQQQQQPQVTESTTLQKSSENANSGKIPPFLLFDAPIELRANFAAAQHANGMQPIEDNNSVHYGMVVKGFHPQQNSTTKNVRLIDGRHGDVGSKRIKNEREQKRTQKISDLIDQLRVKMERGGWKVGYKSKFHTLSSCAEYVKHLVTVNKEREAAVEQAKNDLEAKWRKIEEEKSSQQHPSDPESTTSSLTASSGSASDIQSRQRSEKTSANCHEKPRFRMQESSGSSLLESDPVISSDQAASNVSDLTDGNEEPPCHYTKPSGSSQAALPRTSQESSISTGSSCRGDNKRKRRDEQKMSVCITSSISELTESHKSCESADPVPTVEDKSVLSDAAVAKGVGNDGDTSHPDIIIKDRKRKNAPVSTTSRDFELDYEEVFLKSNVPQVLATTSGRIVAWNDFFLEVTGLSVEDVEHLTIFSLVRTSSLSSLFEIVAAALRAGASPDTDSDPGTSKESPSPALEKAVNVGSDGKWNYTTVTIPCTDFHPIRRASAKGGELRSVVPQLFMTVTLMADEDPRKRCFHCVFTDCPGTNGALGTITPELLSTLFRKQAPAKEGNSREDKLNE